MLENWNSVKPGDILTIHHLGQTRAHKMRVVTIEPSTANPTDYAYLTGERLRMNGQRSNLRSGARKNLPKGQRFEFVDRKAIKAVEPAAPKAEATGDWTIAYRNPRANVKLTDAQIDALHFIGAPDKVRSAYWRQVRPHGRSVQALRDRLYVELTDLSLTEDGRQAYLERRPTGRLPQAFTDAWNGTKALTSEPAPAPVADGPACLTDVEANELSAKTRAAIAGMLGDVTPEPLPTLDELMIKVELVRDVSAENHRPHVEGIRNILRVLYREAGR
jgi:hypothetical protein